MNRLTCSLRLIILFLKF
uniref:Uncharacterized protein n=1 Tax=Arundo donax TaxID=35708 RepID=A0A0A9HMP7_ARUDO